MLSLGTYPEVTLKEAHNQQISFKELLAQGIDPSQHRQEQKQLEAIAAENSLNLLLAFGGFSGVQHAISAMRLM